jgi:hypothetical protein
MPGMGHLSEIFKQKIISYLSSPAILQTNAAAIAPATGAVKKAIIGITLPLGKYRRAKTTGHFKITLSRCYYI